MEVAKLQQDLQKCVEHLKEELAQIRTGRATAELLEPVKIEAYGTVNQLKSLGNISVSDARSLVVQIWDKSILENVSKGIEAANLGFGVSIEGDSVRVTVPELSEERRKDLVKVMKERVETGRIAVRNVRQIYMKQLEEEQKNGISEDLVKRQKEQVEAEVKKTNEMIEELKDKKEADLMTV